jgi:hypothetical protein
MNEHEQLFVDAFIEPARRERAAFCLANPKRRSEFLDKLNHHGTDILVGKCLKSITPSEQHPKNICAILRSLGAPSTCHVISNSELDGSEVELMSALEQVVGYGRGAVISCIPGKVGYFEGEWRERYILQL